MFVCYLAIKTIDKKIRAKNVFASIWVFFSFCFWSGCALCRLYLGQFIKTDSFDYMNRVVVLDIFFSAVLRWWNRPIVFFSFGCCSHSFVIKLSVVETTGTSTNVWHRDVVSITTSSKINCECFSFTFGWNSFTYSCPFFRLILRISRFNSSSFHSMRMVHTDIIRQMHKCDQQQHHRFYEAGGCVWVYLCDEILRFAQTYLIDTNNIYKYGFYELQMLLLYAEAFFCLMNVLAKFWWIGTHSLHAQYHGMSHMVTCFD